MVENFAIAKEQPVGRKEEDGIKYRVQPNLSNTPCTLWTDGCRISYIVLIWGRGKREDWIFGIAISVNSETVLRVWKHPSLITWDIDNDCGQLCCLKPKLQQIYGFWSCQKYQKFKSGSCHYIVTMFNRPTTYVRLVVHCSLFRITLVVRTW